MRSPISVLPLLIVVLAGGCGGYKLGPTSPAVTAGKSIQVEFFRNDTIEPRLPQAVNQALRATLQQDGSYSLDTSGTADIVLTGVFTDYVRIPVGYSALNVVQVSDYELILISEIKATDRRSGKVLLEQKVSGRTTISVGQDLMSSERQALPLLASDLARNITTRITEWPW